MDRTGPARMRPRRLHSRFLFPTLVLVLFLPGCSLFQGPRGGLDYAAADLDLDSLAAVVNRRALSLRTVRGSGDLRIRVPESGKFRKLDVSLVARRPDQLRMRGRVGALASVFDFLADRDTLMLYLPRERAVIVQDVSESRGLPLLASRELVLALLQEPLDVGAVRLRGSFRRIGDGYEVVHWSLDDHGSRTTRRLVFDSEGLRLLHQSIEHETVAGEKRRADITYSRHVWTGAQWFPGEVRMEPGEGGEGLELRFLGFESNPSVDPALFSMPLPPGTRRIDPDELTDDFLGEAPEE